MKSEIEDQLSVRFNRILVIGSGGSGENNLCFEVKSTKWDTLDSFGPVLLAPKLGAT